MGSIHLNKENISDVTEAPASGPPDGTKVFGESISNVPEKYRGTTADRRDMTVLGKKQVLRVSISTEIAGAHALMIAHSEISASSLCSASHQRV